MVVCPASFLSGITVFLGGHSKLLSFKLPVLKFVSLKSPDELFDFNSSLGIFRVALLFICQGTSKAGFCAGAFSESLLSENVSCAKDHCAAAHNEQVLLASWPCICCRFSRQPT